MNQVLEQIKKSIIEGEEDETLELVAEALKKGIDAQTILHEALTNAMIELGELWNKGEVFIPEVMFAAQIFQKAADFLEPHLASQGDTETLGTVVIGTVKGDLHNLGKNLVAIMLRTAGFNVIDLGVDVPAEKFIEEAQKNNAQIIGLSALLTTTMMEQKNVIDNLSESGLRSKFKVIVGGAPVTEEWAKEINADGYARNAGEAVELAKSLLNV